MNKTQGKTVSMTKRRLVPHSVPVGLATVTELEILADAVFYGLESVKNELILVAGVPVEGGAMVKRKVWMVPMGAEATVEAQQGEFVGVVVVEEEPAGPTGPQSSQGAGKRRLRAVWVETEDQALTRQQHRFLPR